MADLQKADAGDALSTSKVGGVREFLCFVLARELYAVSLARIREIVSPPPITPVPRAPRDVLGVCSVRGLLVTVVDLRTRLKLESEPVTRRTRILLTDTGNGEVIGLLVDEVRQVLRLTESEIEPASLVLGGDVGEHLIGVGRPSLGMIILMDLGSIINVPESRAAIARAPT